MQNFNKLIEKLRIFEQEHRDLDQILIQVQEKHTVDFQQIQRLKKRKLLLKDKINELKNKLEPDIIA
ncbi:MAG: hypothetical protein CMI96_02055 [Pelagibacteraceae bacterium]|nr:hypothetical protein [Pelagibacteraceae bacterium]|tara:strand:+ start:34962 stop:35162 length:201 start_codon:yes stop_codon:yes gene_type:complete